MDQSMHLRINEQDFFPSNLAELQACLAHVSRTPFCEIDLVDDQKIAEDGTFYSLIVLTNGERAYLGYFLYEDGPWYESRSSASEEWSETLVEFRLGGNGQIDEYPISWTVSTADALRAVEYAFTEHAPAPWIAWLG